MNRVNSGPITGISKSSWTKYDGTSPSHQETKKPLPKGAPQISKARFFLFMRRYSLLADIIPPSLQSTRENFVSGTLLFRTAASTDWKNSWGLAGRPSIMVLQWDIMTKDFPFAT